MRDKIVKDEAPCDGSTLNVHVELRARNYLANLYADLRSKQDQLQANYFQAIQAAEVRRGLREDEARK